MERFARTRGNGLCLAAMMTMGILAASAGSASADIPAGYKGTPYGGTARPLPGRIDFEHYDLGGPNVAWKHDNKAGAAGSHAGGREGDGEAQHPSFYTTNNNPGEVDKLPDNSLYPSAENPKSVYIGASHASDWVNVTVNVTQAGEYWLSSHFATEGNSLKVHASFNGVNKTGNLNLAGTNGYHNWKYYRNFAKVQLEAGVQVMQFTLDQAHTNWDYIHFSNDSAATSIAPIAGRLPARPVLTALKPLPGSNALRFGLDMLQAGPAHIRILDSRGRVVAPAFSQTYGAGRRVLSIPLGAAASVPLFAEVTAGSAKSTAKILELP